MMHKMSEVRGWSHEDMMKMSKSLFYRYYGYWYIDRLVEENHYEEEERKRKAEANKNKSRNFRPLNQL